MDPPLFGGHIGALGALSHLMLSILTITNAIIIGKNLPSSGTQWLPIMTYIHPLLHQY